MPPSATIDDRELDELGAVVEQLDAANREQERLMAERLRLWKQLRSRKAPVSWAEIARRSGVSDVTVIQAVQGRGGKRR